MLTINRSRFLKDLADLAAIGLLPAEVGGGCDRRPFSPAEQAARTFFAERASAAGLVVSTDAAANLSARLPAADPLACTLLLGSHLDTVPHGGPYDGALGVIAALEVLRTLQEAGLAHPMHLEAVAFTDEEGRFGDFFGSRCLAGRHSAETLARFFERAGAFAEDLAQMQALVPGGLTPASAIQAARRSETLAGYLELHIEQGPRLERAGLPIGVVTAIFGRVSFRLQFTGRADHAGTTPLNLRADALVAAADFMLRARHWVGEHYPDAVITCGGIDVQPGVYNVVPATATLLVEFRAAEAGTLAGIEADLQQLAAQVTAAPGLAFSFSPTSRHPATPMAARMQETIRAACRRSGYGQLDLPSGAGHDAQVLAEITPAGMIFVPSKGGRSHCPQEETDPDDLVAGAQVLLLAVLELAAQN